MDFAVNSILSINPYFCPIKKLEIKTTNIVTIVKNGFFLIHNMKGTAINTNIHATPAVLPELKIIMIKLQKVITTKEI